MKVSPKIFRTYDIRGLYPQEINEGISYLIGRTFVKFLKKSRLKIVVGQDNRLSSPRLSKSLIKGMVDQGAKVIDIGLSTTPMLYFSVAHFKFDGGVNVTASHLPKEFNGFKLVRERAIPISNQTGLKKIQNLVKKGKFLKKRKGKVLKKNIIRDYLNFNFKFLKISELKPLKIVIDTANAIPGILIPYLKKSLPIKIYSLFDKLDGDFPNHQPNPLIKENLKFLKKEVLKRKADFGVAFDGDGDRIIFVDEKGRIIPGDLISALISKTLLRDFPNEKIIYDVRSSNVLPESIKGNGGIPISYRIGHALIKEKMRKEKVLFAGELSGHYYSRSHYFCEAPIFVLSKILEEISQTGKNLSELIEPFKIYFHSGEINFKVENKEKILRLFEKKFKGGQISHLDGLRIDFKDWWFLARPSGTENLLRLVVEAKTKELMKKKKQILANLITYFR